MIRFEQGAQVDRDLNRLAEAHVIAEHAALLLAEELVHPLDTDALMWEKSFVNLLRHFEFFLDLFFFAVDGPADGAFIAGKIVRA